MRPTGVVYWIHLKEHLDIRQDGYVGVTKEYDSRMKKHKYVSSTYSTHLGNAIRKYGWENLIIEKVFIGDEDECYKMEIELRPRFQIGWNEAPGGMGGDRSAFIDYTSRINRGWVYDKNGNNNPFFGKNHTVASKEKMSKSRASGIVTTPDGIFYGFKQAARYYGINKITAKKWALSKEGWGYAPK